MILFPSFNGYTAQSSFVENPNNPSRITCSFNPDKTFSRSSGPSLHAQPAPLLNEVNFFGFRFFDLLNIIY